MNLLITIYNEAIYRPLLNGLVGIYALLPYPDLGLAIMALTVIVRLLLHPALLRGARAQQAMSELQPQLREIQGKFKDDREEQARRTMALYREYGVSPLSGCLPILIQLPVLIGLYRVFWKGITLTDRSLLYSFLMSVHDFNPVALGLFNLTERSAALAIAAGVSQFFQAKSLPASPPAAGGDFQAMLKWQTFYVFPLMIAVISWSLPSALALYWTVFNLLAIVQQRWIEQRLQHGRYRRANQRDSGEDGRPG